MDEFERIDHLHRLFGEGGAAVRLGIGDDAAIVDGLGSGCVLTVDTAVDGVHFRRSWAPLDALAARAFTAAASDLAAMGARPVAALCAFILPEDLGDGALSAIGEGTKRAADAVGAAIVGGNLSAGSELSLTTTVVGSCDGGALSRAGARPGDGIYLSGGSGDRALGLSHLLREGARAFDGIGQAFANAWLHPSARIRLGRALLGVATAAIDISDGLVQDLHHVCEASNVRASIEVDRLPRAPGFDAACNALAIDPLVPLLDGGDAYELIVTADPSAPLPETLVRIGSVEEGAPLVRVLENGKVLDRRRAGHRHFGH